jgi:signal transduction histidine kinase
MIAQGSPGVPVNLADVLFGGPSAAHLALNVLMFAFIAGSFWYTLQERHILAPPRHVLALLLVQDLANLFFSPCNTFLTTAQAGFLMPFRWAPWCIAFQAAVHLLTAAWFPLILVWTLPPYVQTLQPPALWFVAGGLGLVYHILSFGLGALGGHAMRQKWELDRRNAELAAMHQIEAGAARLAERLCIARGLHDELGHHLTALSLQLQLAAKQSEGAARQTIESAYLMARTVLSDIRSTVTDLNEERAIELPKALKTLVLGIHAPRVHLRIGEGVDEVNVLQSHALFRAAQEALTNALRYAHAQRIWVDLDSTPSSYRLVIRDDGQGAPAFAPGNGLRGMHERVTGLGGRLELGPPPGGQGFQVSVQLPRRLADGAAASFAAA